MAEPRNHAAEPLLVPSPPLRWPRLSRHIFEAEIFVNGVHLILKFKVVLVPGLKERHPLLGWRRVKYTLGSKDIVLGIARLFITVMLLSPHLLLLLLLVLIVATDPLCFLIAGDVLVAPVIAIEDAITLVC